MNAKTPICPGCGTKFPGNPCKNCHQDKAVAEKHHAKRLPSGTRKRNKHGRR